jgi:hypothetical protein
MSCPFSRLKKANRSSMAGRTVAASQKIAMVTVGGEVIPFARATLLPADRAQKSHEKRLAIAKALGDLDSIAHALWAIARVQLQQEQFESAFKRKDLKETL